jgi:hypothetical protein
MIGFDCLFLNLQNQRLFFVQVRLYQLFQVSNSQGLPLKLDLSSQKTKLFESYQSCIQVGYYLAAKIVDYSNKHRIL